VKLEEVFRFEVAYQLRRTSTWVFAALLTALPVVMMQAFADGPLHLNAPVTIATVSTLAGLIGVLATATLFGDAATRDVATGTYPLFYTSPLPGSAYLGGRFLGALVVNAILLLGIPLGLLIGTRMPYAMEVTFGPLQAAAYTQPLLLFTLPNLLITAAILFAVATLSRRMLPTYVAGIGLLIGYLFAIERQGSVQNRLVPMLLDPFGAAPLQEITRYWTEVEQNVRLLGFPPILLWNRLLWLGLAAATLVLLHRRFRMALPDSRRRNRSRTKGDDLPLAAGTSPAVPAVAQVFTPRTALQQAMAVVAHSLREILTSRLFLGIAAGALLVAFGFGWDVGAVVFDTSTWHVTHLVATVLALPVAIVVTLLIALFAGELVWSERDARVHEIAGTAPLPDWVPLFGKFLALIGMLLVLQTVLMISGVLLQAVKGYYHFEPGLYVKVLFGLTLANYVLFAALAMTVHVVVNQKALGHLVVILVYVSTIFASELGVRHNLLVYGSDPGWVYSDLNAFGPFIGPFVWFKLYWAGWALVLAVVARLFVVRGTESGVRQRLRLARLRLTAGTARALAVAALLIVTLGGFIFYNTNVLNDYRTPAEANARWAEYERRYKRYERLPQPRITHSELRIEIHPGRSVVELGGSYSLVNQSGEPIASVHVLVRPALEVRSLRFDRAATASLHDTLPGYRIYSLAEPLQPRDSLRLSFDLAFAPRGFPNSRPSTAVVSNGAYFGRSWLPVIGYQPAYELEDGDSRREQGLPPRPRLPPATDAEAKQHRSELRDADLVTLDAVIGTDGDQIAVTAGTLIREWRENGRRYFHYRTEEPLAFGAPFLSARYDVTEDSWNGVALRIYHHPTHTFNLDRMMLSMKASLEYFSGQFGPYQFRELRIVEFPRYANFARAHPHTIAFSEGGAFLTRVEEGDVDRPFFVTAHETAHQWWGGQVAAAQVRGGALLTETLAQYSAMRVMEKVYGVGQVRRFYGYEMDRYLRGRRFSSSSAEVPLLEVGDQSYLYYHKGAIAMQTLVDHIGEERVNLALRRYLEKHRDAGPPYPIARDLYLELQAVTPDSLHLLLSDLFEHITLWNVRTERAIVEPAGDGQYRVTIHVHGSKFRADSAGNETEVPMNDLVDVGVFAGARSADDPGEPLYLRRHRIRSGAQTISVLVQRVPERAGVDPYDKLIQRETRASLVDVETPGDTGRAAGARRLIPERLLR
jgi:ABC-2 type transport system permease protein